VASAMLGAWVKRFIVIGGRGPDGATLQAGVASRNLRAFVRSANPCPVPSSLPPPAVPK
jgi:hypothetical protein